MSRACPICDFNNAKMILQKNGFDIVKCIGCNHVFVKNPENDTSSDFAKDADINKYKTRHTYIYNFLRNHFLNRDHSIKVAEIGAGYGHLGKIISDSGYFDYVGFEPSQERAEFCRYYGLKVINKTFELHEGSYDAIILDNVLEHILLPKQLLEIAVKSVHTGGCIVVIVPNRLDARRFLPRWRERHYWQPHCHISYFSFKDLKKIGSEIGLDFRPFNMSFLGNDASLIQKLKTFFDLCGVYTGGLYTYAVKR